MGVSVRERPIEPLALRSDMRLRLKAHRAKIEFALAVAVFALTALFVVWPLPLHLGSSIYLPPTANPEGGGDLPGSIAHLREFAEGHFPFFPGRIEDFNAPDGLEIRWPLNLASFSSTSVLYLLAVLFGANAAYGLFVIFGYIASGTAMFLLLRSLTGSAWIGVLIGWAFAFYPFAVMKAEHPHFLHGWVFVLLAWRLFALSERPTVRNGLWAGAAGILAVSWTHYFILLAGVFYAALVFTDLLLGSFRGDLRRRLLPHAAGAGLVFGFVFLMRQLLLAVQSVPGVGAANDLSAVIATAAKPLMFVVPSGNTFFGRWTQPFLAKRGLDEVEWTLYLGASTMALGIIGLGAALIGKLPLRLRRISAFGLTAVVTGLIFSAPPQVELFGRVLRTPTYFVFQAAAAYRLYTRFVVVVMFGVCLLAALGLAALTRQRGGRAVAAILVAATLLVPLDLWNKPPNAVRDLRVPPIYDLLRDQPPGILAEYPLRSIPQIGHYLDLYYQGRHDHPILNGYFRGPYEERALSLVDFDDPTVAGKLATLGVRYILLTPPRLVPEVQPVKTPRKGFRFIASDYYGSLYRVTARPRPLVTGWTGFAALEGGPENRFQWAGDAHAQLEVVADCHPCSGLLVFTAASFAQPRRLEIRAPGVGTLRRVTVPTTPIVIAVPLHFNRRILVDLYASPGPQSIAETLGEGNRDIRKVTVWVGSTRFTQFR
jgi:hypothetical protein